MNRRHHVDPMQSSRSSAIRVLGLVLALMLGGTVLAACGSPGSNSNLSLDVGAFQQRAEAEDTVVLDVRTPEEFATGHLPAAVNIDIQATDFADRLAALDKEATYAVYCRSGNRSGVAVDRMLDTGFTDVKHLDGGIVAWQSEGGQVVTS